MEVLSHRTEGRHKEDKLRIKEPRSLCSSRASGFCWPVVSPTSSGQINICNKLCSYKVHLSALQLPHLESKRHGPTLWRPAAVCFLTYCLSPYTHPECWAWPEQGSESEVKRTTGKHNKESRVPHSLGWLNLLTQECSGWRVSPPAASVKNICLWEETPVQEPQGEFVPLQGSCALNGTLQNIHSKYCKDVFSAESEKWTDKNRWRNLLCLLSDSDR